VRKIVLDGLRQVIRQSQWIPEDLKRNWGSSVGTMDASTTEDTSANFGKTVARHFPIQIGTDHVLA